MIDKICAFGAAGRTVSWVVPISCVRRAYVSICEEGISRVILLRLLQTFFIFFAMALHLGHDSPYVCVSDFLVICHIST